MVAPWSADVVPRPPEALRLVGALDTHRRRGDVWRGACVGSTGTSEGGRGDGNSAGGAGRACCAFRTFASGCRAVLRRSGRSLVGVTATCPVEAAYGEAPSLLYSASGSSKPIAESICSSDLPTGGTARDFSASLYWYWKRLRFSAAYSIYRRQRGPGETRGA